MTTGNIQFSCLKQLAEAIVTMFGRNCEVAVHDLSNLDNSLIHIAGNVTGRKIGSPATDLLVQTLRKDFDEIDDICNYKTTTRDGRSIKSTTVFLKNNNGTVSAAFCINLDTTEFFNATQTLKAFINTLSREENEIQETFALSASETIEALFEQCLIDIGRQPASMTTAERIELISLLRQKGVFQMKGAVNRIAELCGVSKYTIYNHIKFIRHQDKLSIPGGKHEKNHKN